MELQENYLIIKYLIVKIHRIPCLCLAAPLFTLLYSCFYTFYTIANILCPTAISGVISFLFF